MLALIVLVTVASISIARRTTTTTNTTQTSSATSSTTSAATLHNALLVKYIIAKTEQYSNSSERITAWELGWNNGTSAHAVWTAVILQTNRTETVTLNRTFSVFPTAQDATNYVNALNLIAYTPVSTNPRCGGGLSECNGSRTTDLQRLLIHVMESVEHLSVPASQDYTSRSHRGSRNTQDTCDLSRDSALEALNHVEPIMLDDHMARGRHRDLAKS